MDSNRRLIPALIATLALLATGGAFAQTIYKQVDENGRVTFTDRPSSDARVVASYESPRAPAQPGAQEDGRQASASFDSRYPPVKYPDNRRADEMRSLESRTQEAQSPIGAYRDVYPAPRQAQSGPQAGDAGSVAALDSSNRYANPVEPSSRQASTPGREIERAVFTAATLATPDAAQIDFMESARRARQEATYREAAPILVVRDPPRVTTGPTVAKRAMSSFYFLWAGAFLVFAAGLLYVGWQVIRLVLGSAFPRWHVGAA